MAYKVFSNGDALTGSELNTYLMNQSVMVFASTTARDAALTAPTEGMVVWLQDANKYVYYTGSAWADLITPASSGNAIINGAFDIWQRGTSFASPTLGSFNADRFSFAFDGTGATRTISQQTFTPGTAPVAGYEGQFFWRLSETVAGTGGTYKLLSQKIEDVRSFAGQTVTVSFWGKADSTKTIGIALTQNFGSGGSSPVTSYSSGMPNLSTSWARFSFTFSLASIAGKTIGTGSYVGVDLNFQTNSTQVVDIWGVQLEAGSVATPFKRNAPSIQAELAACQRYYQRITSTGSDLPISGLGIATSSSAVLVPIPYKVSMRIAPTSVDFAFPKVSNGFSVASNMTSVALSGANTESTNLSLTGGSGLTAGNTYLFYGQTGQTGYVGFSAEL